MLEIEVGIIGVAFVVVLGAAITVTMRAIDRLTDAVQKLSDKGESK